MTKWPETPEGYTYPGGGMHPAFICKRCGAIVADTDAHTDWHALVMQRSY